ncbi:DUF2860 domain-containing protein [Vibrio sp. JPW-9-11-11]|uniref:DUF2860 domain-containing protein n=1 Tax=Vibrio sp. JPW-9-11-11 TaxID=1416532 RepID=UPI0015940534|nr:DUF2860 domain-containing protein [Vibrio sp. JPW-9-11-11]NVD05873.1 DUF2860 domain-containing protein [Vibrio sp. JPW-9-11-11]
MPTKPIAYALAILFSPLAFAQLSDSSGLSGELSLSAGYISSSSNFNTDNNATISDNNQKAQSDSNFLPLPLGSIAFTFGQGLDKQVYAGTSREDIAIGTLALELGFKQQLANGTVIDVSYLPTVLSGETWADPFLVGSPRRVTDEQGNAYRLKLSNIGGSGFTLDTAIAKKEIEDERSGLDSGYNATLLDRNADKLYFKGSFRLFLNRATFLIPSLTYIESDAKGEANSHRSVSGELSLFQRYGRHQLALTASYTDRSYDAAHPVYNLTRDDSDMSVFAAYEYQQLMGWRNLSFISFAGYGQTDSNIQFYDTDQLILSGGINLKF